MLSMESEPLFKATIFAQAYSKANTRKFAMVRGRMISIKGDKAREFESAALKYLNASWRRKPPLEGELIIVANLYYKTQLPDLDASLVFDALQNAGVIKNDRQLREQHLYHGIDKNNPRVELSLYRR